MKYAYETLLRLYPGSWRVAFANEMSSVFEQVSGDCRSGGLLPWFAFLRREFAGLIAGAFFAWTDEYMVRSRRRLTAPFLISLLAGAAITAFFQGSFYSHVGQHEFVKYEYAPGPEAAQPGADLLVPMLLAGGTLLLISVFSIAFVWNMRVIGNRAGRLKPIWMPGRAANARITRRDQTLHRNPGGQRRELHRRVR